MRREDAPAVAPAQDASSSAADDHGTGRGPLDLVRGVVEQIVGHTLKAAEIDAMADRVQPLPLAFDHVRKLDAAARARETRASLDRARAAVSWGASLELQEPATGGAATAVTGSLTGADGREVSVEARLTGKGDTVIPMRLDIETGADGKPVALRFSGRAVDADGTPGTGEAAVRAAWAGLPVRVTGADGSMRVTTFADAHASGGLVGGTTQIDLVA